MRTSYKLQYQAKSFCDSIFNSLAPPNFSQTHFPIKLGVSRANSFEKGTGKGKVTSKLAVTPRLNFAAQQGVRTRKCLEDT